MTRWDTSFKLRRVVTQANPLPPILFNLVVDMLAVLKERSNKNEHFYGLVPHLVEGGLYILNMRMTQLFLWKMI
jgi:hypothetical protein